MMVNKVKLSNGETLIDISGDSVAPETLAEGVTAHDKSGAVIRGVFTLANEMSAQDGLIAKIKAALKGKAAGGASTPTQEKTVEITENGTVEVVPDEGHALSKVTAKVNVPVGDLPSGYSRVDFIEFTGKQLVDTGIIGNQDTQIDVSFTWGNVTQNHVFGCASSDNIASITSYMNGSWRFGNKTATKAVMKNNTVLPYAARVNKSMIGVTNSNTAISDVNDFETIGTLLLGGARSSNGALPSTGFVGRVFYFRLWSGSTQIMNLVPVTDGAAFRFYDLVTRTFFDSITDAPLEGGNL